MTVRAVSGMVARSGRRLLSPVVRVRGQTLAAPVKGWNTRDPLSEMSSNYASILDNWFPNEGWLSMRRGYSTHVTGIGAVVESLMSWSGVGTTARMFAAGGNKIYDVSIPGAVGAAAVSGMTNNYWQHVMFGTSAGNFLYIVNGEDSPRYYNGSIWAVPTLTGTTASNMVNIDTHKRRLIFVEKNSLSFWYLPVVSIAGTLVEFPLDGLCKKGGYLMATGSWTRDGGSGPDDFFVAITSNGEVIIYQGTDPGDANAWSLVGVFNIAPPLGRRCLLKLGSDLIVMTEDGFSQLSRFLAGAQASSRAAMSDTIAHSLQKAINLYKDRRGWQPIFYPSMQQEGSMLLFNAPVGNSAVQYISNATTGAWCRYTGWNAKCWVHHAGHIFFAVADGTIYHADHGFSDNGTAIVADMQQAFSYFGDRTRKKRFAMVRPNLILDGSISVALNASVDSINKLPTGTASFSSISGVAWDAGTWDVDAWADDPFAPLDWQNVNGVGYSAALRMQVTASNGSAQLNSTNWLFEPVKSAGYL